MPKEGQVWPLQLVFLVLLILAILGFFAPQLFAGSAAAKWFGGGALFAGCLLYIPVAVTWFRARPEIMRWIDTTAGSVIGRLQAIETQMSAIGDPQAPGTAPASIIGRLDVIQTQVGAIGKVDLPSSVVGRLHVVQTLVGAIGNPDGPGDAPNSVVGRLQAIQVQAVPVGDVNTARTVLQRLAGIETKLEDIEANLSKKLDELRKPGS